jgi:uncharacterized protein
MPDSLDARRLRRLPLVTALGRRVYVARGPRARLLGLAHLDRGEAGAGLLIPRCSSVHTFGMRFSLDLYFIGGGGQLVFVRRAVPPRRFAFCRQAAAVLEIPAQEGGEILGSSS